MKNILLFLISLIFFLKSSAQPNYFSVANQKGFSSVTYKIINPYPHRYFTVGAYGGTILKEKALVSCFNDSGEVVFEKELFNFLPDNYYYGTDIIKTSDNNLLCAGYSFGCDAAAGAVHGEKFDSSGTTLFSKTYEDYSPLYWQCYITELPSHGLAICYGNKILFTDSIGDSLSLVTLTNDSVYSFVSTPDDYLLIGYKNLIEKRNLNGTIASTGVFSNHVKNITIKSSDEYVFTSSATIYRTDSMFNIIDSMDLQSQLPDILDISEDSSGYLILGSQKVIEVDSSFNPVSGVLNIDSTLAIKSLLVEGSKLILAGEEKTGPFDRGTHPVVKSYDLNYQTLVETQDAGVMDISSDTMLWSPFGGLGPTLQFNLYATVKNFGLDTMHSVAANFYMYPTVANCNILEASGFVNGVSIAPQDTIRIYIGSFYIPFIANGQTLNFCVWSSAPDNHIDINHSNDMFCKALNVTHVGVDENSLISNLQISPNPTISSIRINIPELKYPVNISLTDISGKEIIKEIIDKTNTDLSLINLNPGMYFLRFNFANQSVVKKIIKQ